jgi:hypothetical protein
VPILRRDAADTRIDVGTTIVITLDPEVMLVLAHGIVTTAVVMVVVLATFSVESGVLDIGMAKVAGIILLGSGA